MNFGINESIDIDGITFTIVAIKRTEDSLDFTVLINNIIHYTYGKMLSQKYPFDNYNEYDIQKNGQIFLELDNQSYKCERRIIDYGKNTIMYIYSLEFDEIQLPEINNASIHISEFCLTEYKKR